MESIAYEELLKKEGKLIIHVVGNSMLPLLHDRKSIVILEDVNHVPPQQGDVVLYKIHGTYILHRIIKIKQDEYIIRGDNTVMFEHVPKKCLLATMTGFYRKPDRPLVQSKSLIYRLYCHSLPAIRQMRRRIGQLRKIIRKAAAKLHFFN